MTENKNLVQKILEELGEDFYLKIQREIRLTEGPRYVTPICVI